MADHEVRGTATVTQPSPLRVVVDGATTDSIAYKLNETAYLIGDRVTVMIRNPQPPLVEGKETA